MQVVPAECEVHHPVLEVWGVGRAEELCCRLRPMPANLETHLLDLETWVVGQTDAANSEEADRAASGTWVKGSEAPPPR